jgi:hypothetical protein
MKASTSPGLQLRLRVMHFGYINACHAQQGFGIRALPFEPIAQQNKIPG